MSEPSPARQPTADILPCVPPAVGQEPAECYRLMLDAVEDTDTALFTLSPDGRVRTWTGAARQVLQHAAEEAAGQPFSRFFSPDTVADGAPQRWMRTARESGRAQDKCWLVRRDGSTCRAGITLMAMRDEHGADAGYVVALRDLTRERRLEELEGIGRRVQAFLAILAHELRNPLAPIRNAVDVIRLTPVTDPRVRHCAEIIGRQLQQLSRLVSDLMDVGRVTSGKLKVQLVPTSFHDIVLNGLETIRPALDAASQRLMISLPQEPVYVNADVSRLGQVLNNVLGNANKYTPRGGTITVRVAVEDGKVITTIADTGRGIAPAAVDRIFHLFAQEPGGSNRGGLGIGLALARGVVEAHGGEIRASSPGEGLGSTFTVVLPQVQIDGYEMARPERLPSARQRLLIVDDNVDSADSMVELLTVLGHDARPAYSGAQALELAPSFCPECVLLDLEMPDMSGYDVLAGLRDIVGPGVRIFAFTGRGTAEDRRRAIAAGFDGHLVKPLTIEVLCRALEAPPGIDPDDVSA